MAYRLRTLAPVHIHSGDILKPMEYIVKDEEVLIFDEIDVIGSIKENELLNKELLNTYTFSSKRSEYYKNLDYYINKGIIDKSIENKYKVKANNKVGKLDGKDIHRTMRNIKGPYIPGSTIKGVIRTAILYDYILHKDIGYIEDALNFIEKNSINRSGKKIAKYDIEDYIIYFTNTKEYNRKNIQGDPFKFIITRDVNFIYNKVEIYQQSIFNPSGKTPIPGNIIECVEKGDYTEEFYFSIEAKEEQTKGLKSEIDYNDELLSYFDKNKLLRALYKFSRDILNDEIEYFKKLKNHLFNSKEIIEALEDISNKNSEKSPVLRIGRHKGYKSNTLALAIKKLDKEFYNNNIRKIANVKHGSKYEFPKTRNFVGNSIAPKLLGFTILEKVD